MPKKLTQEEFLAKAVAVHGDRYDYSRTVYMPARYDIAIGCRLHGVFRQNSASHLNGHGCKKCATEAQNLELEQFIAKARAVHGNRYDYSRTVYKNWHGKVEIACPEHGIFEQAASTHINQGSGCRLCSIAQNAVAMANDLTTFIAKARAVHGNRYDYSRTVYKNAVEPVTISCSIHGEFRQSAASHLKKSGCQKCASTKQSITRAHTTEQFIAKARAVHGNRYDYSRTVYCRSGKEVLIICPQHGEFEQVAHTHLNASGCPHCGNQNRSYKLCPDWIQQANGRTSTLYFLRIFGHGEVFYKIGITFQEVKRRFRSSKSHLGGYQHEILAQHTSTDAARTWGWERSILKTFAHLRYHPKVKFDGDGECFSSCDEILAIFPL